MNDFITSRPHTNNSLQIPATLSPYVIKICKGEGEEQKEKSGCDCRVYGRGDVGPRKVNYLYELRFYLLCWCPRVGCLHADVSSEPLSKSMDQPLHFTALSHDRELYYRESLLRATTVKLVSPERPVQDVDLIFWEKANEALDTPNTFLR